MTALKQAKIPGMEKTLDRMRQTLSDLGYEDLRSPYLLRGFGDLDGMEDMAALVAFDAGDPVVLCHPVEPGLVDDEAVQKDAQFKAGTIGPDQIARFVWVSDGSYDHFYDLVRESTVSGLPRRENWRGKEREAISTTQKQRIQQEALYEREINSIDLRSRFNQLHEELYGKRAGVSTTNEAIDEVGKIMFLKMHTERYPHDELQEGPGQGKKLGTIFRSSYVEEHGRQAVAEIAAAFREIQKHDDYQMPNLRNGDRQGIFPPDEPFRINDPEILSSAISILLARISPGLSSNEGKDLSLLPVEIPALIEHERFEGSQSVAGF